VHIFLNAVAASAASGLTYVRNIVPHLRQRKSLQITILTSGYLREEFVDSDNLKFRIAAEGYSTTRRFWFEQNTLPEMIRQSRADILISAGNFALRRSPVPQILLSGNALYCSQDFSQDLLRRRPSRSDPRKRRRRRSLGQVRPGRGGEQPAHTDTRRFGRHHERLAGPRRDKLPERDVVRRRGLPGRHPHQR